MDEFNVAITDIAMRVNKALLFGAAVVLLLGVIDAIRFTRRGKHSARVTERRGVVCARVVSCFALVAAVFVHMGQGLYAGSASATGFWLFPLSLVTVGVVDVWVGHRAGALLWLSSYLVFAAVFTSGGTTPQLVGSLISACALGIAILVGGQTASTKTR